MYVSLVRRAMNALALLLILVCAVAGSIPAKSAVEAQRIPASIAGVFFYSPACPHCHEVLENHWPAIEDRFGDQLRIVFVDVSTQEGASIMAQTLAYLGMEPTGVPLLVIHNEVMVGSLEIPQRATEVIEAAIESGGAQLPPIPALLALVDVQAAALIPETGDAVPTVETPQEDHAVAATPNALIEQPTLVNAVAVASAADALAAAYNTGAELGILQRLMRDPLGNGVALVVLGVLALSLVLYALYRLFDRVETQYWGGVAQRMRTGVLALVAIFGMGLSVAILAGALETPTIIVLGFVQLAAFTVLFIGAIVPKLRVAVGRWTVAVAALAGLLVATYLAYVEATMNPAVCGTVGECNLVQQSAYASLMGIPIGVVGMAGFVLILAVALIKQWAPEWLGDYGNPLLEALALAGVAFSTWLTFLEPFVIGATCAWCLISALWMLAIFWQAISWEKRELGGVHNLRRARKLSRQNRQRLTFILTRADS